MRNPPNQIQTKTRKTSAAINAARPFLSMTEVTQNSAKKRLIAVPKMIKSSSNRFMSYLSTIVEDNDTNIAGNRQADSEGYSLKTVRGNKENLLMHRY